VKGAGPQREERPARELDPTQEDSCLAEGTDEREVLAVLLVRFAWSEAMRTAYFSSLATQFNNP
jgi:hypothetical protein